MKRISSSFWKIAVVCAVQMTAIFSFASDSKLDADLRIYDRMKIRQRPSGIFEADGRVFFHQRVPVAETDEFGKVEAEATARSAAVDSMFSWIDERSCPVTVTNSAISALSALNSRFVTDDCRIDRTVSVETRTLCCDSVSGNFVFTMVVDSAALLKEAQKGCFKDRPSTIIAQWKSLAVSSLAAPENVRLLRQLGALDILTLGAECRGTVKEFSLADGDTNAVCRQCIENIRQSVKDMKGPAVDEYVVFLAGLYSELQRELEGVKLSGKYAALTVMLCSYASQEQKKQKENLRGLQAFSLFRRMKKPNGLVKDRLLAGLAQTPGSALLWTALGECFQSEGKSHVALSCYRNALRIQLNNPYAIDRMAISYDVLGYHGLAGGLALLAYGLTDDETCRQSARTILNLAE